jgi:polyphosphate glucokinase
MRRRPAALKEATNSWSLDNARQPDEAGRIIAHHLRTVSADDQPCVQRAPHYFTQARREGTVLLRHTRVIGNWAIFANGKPWELLMPPMQTKSAFAPASEPPGNRDLPFMAESREVRTDFAAAAETLPPKRVLVVDVGGNNVKILASGQNVRRSFPSGPKMTPKDMISGVKRLAADWEYDAVSIGYPGPVLRGRPVAEPRNLGCGWVGFDFAHAFGRPVKIVNDAAMQALGSYRGGKMLFLGLGTGLGSTMIVAGSIEPMELGHLPYRKSTYENYVGRAGLKRHGKKKWRRHVADVVKRLIAALQPDETVIGGGNVRKLAELPPHSRAGDNANAFRGGLRLWQDAC